MVTFDRSVSYASLSEYAIQQHEIFDIQALEDPLSKSVVIRNIVYNETDYILMMLKLEESIFDYYESLKERMTVVNNITLELNKFLDYVCNNSKVKSHEIRDFPRYEVSLYEIARDLQFITFDLRNIVIPPLYDVANSGNFTDVHYRVVQDAIGTRIDLLSEIRLALRTFLEDCILQSLCNTTAWNTMDHIQSMYNHLDNLTDIANGLQFQENKFDIHQIEETIDSIGISAGVLRSASHYFQSLVAVALKSWESRYVAISMACTSIHHTRSEIKANEFYIETYLDPGILSLLLMVDLPKNYVWTLEIKANRSTSRFTETYLQKQVRNHLNNVSFLLKWLDPSQWYLPIYESVWKMTKIYVFELANIGVTWNYTDYKNLLDDLIYSTGTLTEYIKYKNDELRGDIDKIRGQMIEAEQMSNVDSNFYRYVYLAAPDFCFFGLVFLSIST